MHQIIIIGTIPPCPRCRLLTEIVREKVKSLGLDAEVRHISYTSEEAAAWAAKEGLKPGTAKDVAALLGEKVDPEEMPSAAEVSVPDALNQLEPNLLRLDNLFREVNILDNWLRPLENRARQVGILMTPVLIASGSIQHSGSVPDLAFIDQALSGLE
jgi:hypothetical protein